MPRFNHTKRGESYDEAYEIRRLLPVRRAGMGEDMPIKPGSAVVMAGVLEK